MNSVSERIREFDCLSVNPTFRRVLFLLPCAVSLLCVAPCASAAKQIDEVEPQPFVAQVRRLIEAMEYLGEPFSAEDRRALERAAEDTDAARGVAAMQNVLDRRVLLRVEISPESRVKVTRGSARATLVEAGWRSFLVKVRNEGGVTAQLRAESPHALPVYARGISDIPGGFSLDPVPRAETHAAPGRRPLARNLDVRQAAAPAAPVGAAAGVPRHPALQPRPRAARGAARRQRRAGVAGHRLPQRRAGALRLSPVVRRFFRRARPRRQADGRLLP